MARSNKRHAIQLALTSATSFYTSAAALPDDLSKWNE